jgi:competence protein ComEC
MATASAPGEGATGRTPRGRALFSGLARNLAAEREQWALWVPVAVGAGVAGYFGLPVEPPLWPAATIAAGGFALAWLLRGRRFWPLIALGLALVAAGCLAAELRTRMVAAPALGDDIGPVEISGRVLETEPLPNGRRLLLGEVAIEDLPASATPARVRVRVSRIETAIGPGDQVRLLASLTPPSAPFAPGAYDFQRDAYFREIGAVGFALGAPTLVASADPSPWRGFSLWIARLRDEIGGRVRTAIPGRAGPVAAALVVGSQTGIDKSVMEAMRDSGLAHLLSISGLHVGFVAAIFFGLVRGGLSLVPPIALRHPIKKWAAVVALLGTYVYVLLAGSPVPTQRAFLMTGLVMLAILVDRVAITLRLVAWAALVILLLRPEALAGPSFQMSFAAVAALVAAYDGSRDWRARRRAEAGWSGRALLYLGGLVFTSLVAGLATAPFALYHFNRFAGYGVVANMLAVPLTGFVAMPAAVAGVALMPFGLEAAPLAVMGWAVEGVIRIAETAASWPGSVLLLPAMPLWGLLLASAGGLWLLLWRGRWRYAGVLALVAGIGSIALARTPDILVSGDGELVAVRSADGGLAVNSRRGGLEAEIWLRRAGDGERDPWPASGAPSGAGGWLTCDATGCIYDPGGHVVALAWKAAALQEDCYRADLVISLEPVRGACPARAVIDRFDLWRKGGHSIWLEAGGFRILSVEASRGDRPWVIRRARKPS